MSADTPSYARLPTYSAVIDGLAACLGIILNKEDALTSARTFSKRIAIYNNTSLRMGLEDQILSLLAGSDEALKSLLRTHLSDVESALTDARADPLVTWHTEKDGRRRFFEICAAPWIGNLLVTARSHTGSVLNSARLLLEAYVTVNETAPRSYFATWKAEIRRALPAGVRAAEFRAKLNRLDGRSQRKNSSIEEDMAELKDELRSGISSPAKLEEVICAIRSMYLAGMATSRLCASVSDVISEYEILSLIKSSLDRISSSNASHHLVTDRKNLMSYRHALDIFEFQSDLFINITSRNVHIDPVDFDGMRADLAGNTPESIWSPAIDYAEGLSHLFHGRDHQAERSLQSVVEKADSRQLGEIAADAASILIALELTKPGPFKFGKFNPLLRTRIDNMPQWDELRVKFEPSPFSNYSSPPETTLYDLHLMMCVARFNSVERSPGIHIICNPLERFDKVLAIVMADYEMPNATMKVVERKIPAIAGTSVTPYQFLRNSTHYLLALFGQSSTIPEMAGIDAYLRMSNEEQLRILCFVDPAMFKHDLEAHGSGYHRSLSSYL